MQENEKLNVDELDITLGQNVDVIDEVLEDGVNAENEEGQEMTEEEQRQLYIEQLKKMHMRFNPIKHVGNKTIHQFGVEYKQKRKQKNRQAKAARKTNRQKK